MLYAEGGRLVYRFDAETLWLEPWGDSALRVRATHRHGMPTEDWALEKPKETKSIINIVQDEATISNGNIKATITSRGKITIYNQHGSTILSEYSRNRKDPTDPKCSALDISAREFKPNTNGSPNYHVTMRLESLSSTERLYGMGQYQQSLLDLKGSDLELAHRNSQASIPFLLSSIGYGILWNNPAVGRAVLGKNVMTFESYSTACLDYWIVSGASPSAILESYTLATGRPPMMPEYGLGFWQCKLRYQTQDELLSVAREYHRRRLKVDVIVVDFFHWPVQGTWEFDKNFWPDPDAMVAELRSMGMELMVSIWPTVDTRSPLYPEMLEKGFLHRADRGYRTGNNFMGDTVYWDATNPEARQYLWQRCRKNYYDRGIRIFWLDEAEPEYSVYDFDNYRYWRGSDLEIGNIYPKEFARTFYEGMTSSDQKEVVNLLRCAWAGSAKYGTLVWSGDIASSWESFRDQLCAGLNMGLSGIPWWTTDIGGFHGGDPQDEKFRELLVRWFQWGCFCPVMRLHGDREPKQPKVGEGGGSDCRSGASNEVWSYGDKVGEILVKYLRIRDKLRDYVRGLMREAHEKGSPVMRTMFYVFPHDRRCWEESVATNQYMFGDRYLCAPVLEPGLEKRKVYLPTYTRWKIVKDGILGGDDIYEGGNLIDIDCPLDTMPVLVREIN